MALRLLSLFAAVLLVAACETAPEEVTATTGEGAGPVSTMPGGMAMTPEGYQMGSEEHFIATVGDRVFFDFDKYDLKPEAQRTLRRWADWLQEYHEKTVQIQGHCDERGTREYNLALGERRATATKNFLVALGVDSGRLSTISFGKERPAVLGSNEQAWAQNRRGQAKLGQ